LRVIQGSSIDRPASSLDEMRAMTNLREANVIPALADAAREELNTLG
jgi:hypothetical protein